MKQIIFATNNQGKVGEVKEILKDLHVDVRSLKDAGIHMEVEETGKTFQENAFIKARAISKLKEAQGTIVLADDSGLEVDYLNKEPGVYSARYMGEKTSYHIKNKNIIERLSNAKEGERSARFVCAIAAVLPDGKELFSSGTIEGEIGYEEKGDKGFGYDPIFYLPEYQCTAAELDSDRKNQISHRGLALEEMKNKLKEEYHER